MSDSAIPYRPLPPIQTVFPKPLPPLPPKPKADGLTPEQVENWRNHLLNVIGPFAMLLSAREIEAVRDGIQEKYGALASKITGVAPSVSKR